MFIGFLKCREKKENNIQNIQGELDKKIKPQEISV